MAAQPATELDLAFNYPQWQAWNAVAPRRTIFLGFGRGVGKSWFLRTAWWLLVAEWDGKLRSDALKPFRGVRITVLMPTLTQFKDVHLAGIENDLVNGDFACLNAKIDRQRGHVTFPGGSWVKPFPANAYNARTARGMRCDVLCADEYDDTEASVYDAVAVPWLSEPWSLGIELVGGTPTRGRHGLWWRTLQAGRLGEKLRDGGLSDAEVLALPEVKPIADRFEDDADPAIIVEALRSTYAFHATYRDAPETVSSRAVAKARANTLPATFEREWEANADAGEGLVYPFDETFHVRQPPPEREWARTFREFHVGMDHGWVDPGVLILFGVQGHGEDAVVWALDESYESMVPTHEWDERAKKFGYATFWGDPSRPERIDAIRAMGIPTGEVDNEILAGVARVADMLFIRTAEGSDERWAKFYVSPKCVNLIREFGLYRRKKLPNGDFGEKPEDRHNHAMDATRYVLYGRFGRAPNYRTELTG